MFSFKTQSKCVPSFLKIFFSFLIIADCFENMITNVTYTASSTKTNYPPSDAVIDNDGAWCTDEIPPNQYLDVKLGNLYDVCGVKIQGYADGTVNSYPSKYKLAFSSKENVWSVPTQVNILHAYPCH